jgi:hypothetical protein
MLIGSVIMIDYRFYEDLACCECISILWVEIGLKTNKNALLVII